MTVIFLHIEKAGGVTLKDILSRQYKNIFDIARFKDYGRRRQDLIAMSNEEKKQIELIQGHQYYGLHEFLPGDYVYITMLREPVARCISAYRYYRRTKDAPLHEAAMDMGLSEFVKSRIKPEMDNGMTRMLFGEEVFGDIHERHAGTAKNNLEKCFVGLTEKYDESLCMFESVLDWKRKPYYTQANKSKIFIEITRDDVNLLKKYNQYDLELYEYAKKTRFVYTEHMDSSVRKFQLLNKTIGRFYIKERAKRWIERNK